MQKINKATYNADAGEVVTLELIPQDMSADFVVVSLDGKDILPSSSDFKPTYSFVASQPHHLLAIRGFFDTSPSSSKVAVRISGSAGTENFSGPTVDKNHPEVLIKIGTRTGGPR
jgi:hypothetical protein